MAARLAPFSILIAACAVVLLPGCATKPVPQAEAPRTEAPAQFVPHSGDEHVVSPLAQLMREMTAFADSTKQHLATGRELLPYPAHFRDMLTAEPTPGMVDHRVYDPFAFFYLHQLDSLYSTPPQHRNELYNAVVQGCANCHGQVCPGPLVRIKKLYAH